MELLKAAGLVTTTPDGSWRILRSRPGLGRDNVHVSLATRATRAARAEMPKPKRVKKQIEGSGPLSEDADQLLTLLDEQAKRD